MLSGWTIPLVVTMLVRIIFLALLSVTPAHAGCKKRKATNVLPDEVSLNAERYLSASRSVDLESLPKEFSWLGQNMLAPSWNQHIPQYCGSCWLHGTLSMIQDRLKIQKKGLGPDVMLARQSLLNCAAFHDLGGGCDGGDVIDVLRYMTRYGLPDESCQPYTATDHTKYGKKATKCPAGGYCSNCMTIDDKDTCWSVKSPIRYFLDGYGTVDSPGEEAMMKEIYAGGPITCSLATPDKFDYGYHSGVYVDPDNVTDVDHDVEVVGWGETDDGQKYWIIRNSWGTYWGQLGFFKLERGTNALQIEAGDCWWAVPTWKDEKDVRDGKMVGTMWGIFTAEEAEKIKPEPGKHPHEDDDTVAAF